jgi:hypothetical protein
MLFQIVQDSFHEFDLHMSLREIVSSDPKLFIDGGSLFPCSSYKFAVHIMLQQMRVKIQMEAIEPLLRKVIVPEGHSMEAEWSRAVAVREKDCWSDLYVLAGWY